MEEPKYIIEGCISGNIKFTNTEYNINRINSFFTLQCSLNQPDWTIEEFRESDNLATFSIAFVLLDHTKTTFVESFISSPKVEIRVRTYNNASHDSAVHETVCNILEFFTKILSPPNSLRKLDVVIAPDMSFDVIGNYGLIFMR